MAKTKQTTLSLSYRTIDNAIKELKKLKKEGYKTIEGIQCDCWHSCCNNSCCFSGCICGSLEITK